MLRGGEGDDQIEGDSATTGAAFQGVDELYGEAGSDFLRGQGGDDYIDGGADNDIAFGDEGEDVLVGGAGNDQLAGDTGDDSPDGYADFIEGGDGGDQLFGEGGGFGYTGSIGMARSSANLRTLQGLEEGFQRLRA
ncbi:MAG: calcium-binding protein [Tepidiformaceae bacterium]